MVDQVELLEPIYAEFGAWMKERRKWCGYTQDDLAFHLGLGRTSIVNIEKGKQRVLLHTALDAIEMLSHDPRLFRRFFAPPHPNNTGEV